MGSPQSLYNDYGWGLLLDDEDDDTYRYRIRARWRYVDRIASEGTI